MPILTKEVEVRVNGFTSEYYKNLGYEIPMKKASTSYFKRTGKEFVCDTTKIIIVKVDDLPNNSDARVEVLCDVCQKESAIIRYADYTRAIKKNGHYICKRCSVIKREQDKIIKYNDVYFNTEEFKTKRKNSMKQKYGVEHYLQDKDNYQKYQEVCKNKYGENYKSAFREKAKETSLRLYGYENPSCSPEIKEKTRFTNLQKYGVPNTMQSPKVRAKANETLCRNGTQKTSKQQLYLHNLYGGELNYPIKYYAVDICFPEEKLIIEYDGGGHDLRVTLGRLTQEEFNRKEIIRNNIIKREGYKRMNIVSKSDLLPSDSILLQMLNDARNYFLTTQHSWCIFDIDQSLLFNAKNKNGIPYNYSSLRTIT